MGGRAVRDSQPHGRELFFCDYADDRGVQANDAAEEDDGERTELVIARTEWGQMMDFLKNFPFVTREEYMWEWTVPQIRIASSDSTHIKYLSKREIEMRKAKVIDGSMLVNDVGIPIL